MANTLAVAQYLNYLHKPKTYKRYGSDENAQNDVFYAERIINAP